MAQVLGFVAIVLGAFIIPTPEKNSGLRSLGLLLVVIGGVLVSITREDEARGTPAPASLLTIGTEYEVPDTEVPLKDVEGYRTRLKDTKNVMREFILPERLSPGTYIAKPAKDNKIVLVKVIKTPYIEWP